MRSVLWAGVLACAFGLPSAAAQADVFLEVIDVGVPTDGTTTMDGFRGFVIRAVSDDPDDPITGIKFGDPGAGAGRGIYGDLHQRWTSPFANGDYTETSPGFLDADNSFPTDLNFDSHFLPPPPEAMVSLLSEEYPLFYDGIDDSPVPSTPLIGYSDPFDVFEPIGVEPSQRLEAIYDIPASAGVFQVEVAYIVTDSRVNVSGAVLTPAFPSGFGLGASIAVPEPGTAGVLATFASLFGLVRPTRRRGRRTPALEPGGELVLPPMSVTTAVLAQ